MSQLLWEPIPTGDQDAPPLRLTLFGAMEVQVRGVPSGLEMSRRASLLLAALALRHPHPAERSALAAMLWPEAEEERGLFYVRRTLSELRKTLGPEKERLLSPAAHTLRLELSGAVCDVAVFDAAVRRGDPVSLEKAISLYRGALLEGHSAEWLEPERAWRAEAFLAALETLAAERQRAGDPAAAVRLLRRAVAIDPLRESAHRGLLEALGAYGDQAGVERQYRELRSVLLRELNCEPGAECAAVYRRLTAAAREARREPPPPAAQAAGPARRLPCPPTPLVGRAAELKEVVLALDTARLVTLTGPGGVGKTRLAIAAAEELVPGYDGVWFTDLAPVLDPALVPHIALAALGFRLPPDQTPCQMLASHLGARRALLLLDNCEHLVDACAGLAAHLLRECPEIRILATSRQPLGVPGERIRPVPPLSLPAPRSAPSPEDGDLRGLLESGAVRLFLDRAEAASPRFRLTAANAEAVVRTCTQLEGIPLAIELAAARLKVLSAHQIAGRLGDRFRLLTGGSRTALPRQQTLRATVDWSYDLLSEAERRLFHRLSVFAGGWTLEAAEAMADGGWQTADCPDPSSQSAIRSDEVLDLLGQLVEKSVVMMDELHPAGAGAARYRLLETLREYGQDRLLESGEREAARRRHLDYFLGLAEEGESKRYGADEAAWLERMEVENDNLRAALAWAVEAEEIGLGLRLGGALWRFWSARGYAMEGRRQLARLLTLAGSPARAAGARAEDGWRARALLGAASLSLEGGDYRAARSLCEESLGLWRTLGDRGGVADTLAALGIAELAQGGYVAARSLFAQALSIQRELRDRWGVANSLERLGQLAYYQGDYDLARDLVEGALAIRRELGDRRGIAQSLAVLGSIAWQHGDYEAARLANEESLAIYRELGDKVSIGSLLNVLGDLAQLHGEYARSRELLEESLAICEEIDDPGAAANTRQGLGQIAFAQGEHGRAEALFMESLAVYRKLPDPRGIAWALADLGTVALRQGDWEAAARHYRESLALRRDLNDRRGTAESLEGLAALASAMGQARRAARLFGAAEGLRKSMRAPGIPSAQEANRRSVSRTREMLPEEAFAAAWAEGRAMTLEQAIACALEEDAAV